jgi:hypothetical protein
VRVGRVTAGVLEPPQPAREQVRTPAITTARDTGMQRKKDLTETKDIKAGP